MPALFSPWEISSIEKFLQEIEDEIKTKIHNPLSLTLVNMIFQIIYCRLKIEEENATNEFIQSEVINGRNFS